MAWADAKARIVEVLETLEITEPEAQTIKRVYPNPPGTIGDVPCVIVYPPALTVVRQSSSLRKKVYTIRMLLLVKDADLSQAAALVDAYREAMIDLFDTDLTLNYTASIIDGPNIDAAADFIVGDRHYTGMDCILGITLMEAANYQP